MKTDPAQGNFLDLLRIDNLKSENIVEKISDVVEAEVKGVRAKGILEKEDN
jgi:hypothetical protein